MSKIVCLPALLVNESSGKCHKNLTQIPSWLQRRLLGYHHYCPVLTCNMQPGLEHTEPPASSEGELTAAEVQ